MGIVELWRMTDVAELYGVDASTVHRCERTGRVRAARRDPGDTKYWLAAEVLADIANPPVAPSEPARSSDVDRLVEATRRRRRRAG